ncbi:MAG: hypothetical protein Q4F72_11990, partial [Desulfovibrionaceae bacterium]|nr:hypothetical protein [Desulfovibrionaceae bacterium]
MLPTRLLLTSFMCMDKIKATVRRQEVLMPAKPSGETKVYIIHDTQDNGDVYVYRREVEYDPARRNNRVRSSKLLGKIRKGESEMIPTRPRRKRADGQEGGSTAVQTGGTGAGIADILEHIGRESGIDEAILRHAGEGTARKILSIARYLAATGGQPLPGMAIWQTTHCLPYTDEITEDLCNDLFLSVGRDEALQQGYFADRCRSLGDRSALACDLTVYPVELLKESQDMDAVEAHRDGQNSIKFVTLHSAGERQPFAFAGTDSPLSDIARIDLALERLSVLGMENILLMAEDGFRSEDSALELCLTGCDYVTPAPISTSWVRAELDQAMAGGRFETTGSVCPFDVDVHCATAALTHAFRQTKLYRKYRNGLEDNLDEDSFSHNIYLHLYLNTRDRDEY